LPILIRFSGKIRIIVYPGDHLPTHVHVKDNQYEVKIDISGDIAQVIRSSKDERFKTTPKFTEKALQLCQANLEFLQEEVKIYYEAE
jgi:pantothenate kinase